MRPFAWDRAHRVSILARVRHRIARLVARARGRTPEPIGFLTAPGARPFFDGSTPLSDVERAEYRGHSRIFGMLEDRVAVPDEGPDQPEPGVAVGAQSSDAADDEREAWREVNDRDTVERERGQWQ